MPSATPCHPTMICIYAVMKDVMCSSPKYNVFNLDKRICVIFCALLGTATKDGSMKDDSAVKHNFPSEYKQAFGNVCMVYVHPKTPQTRRNFPILAANLAKRYDDHFFFLFFADDFVARHNSEICVLLGETLSPIHYFGKVHDKIMKFISG